MRLMTSGLKRLVLTPHIWFALVRKITSGSTVQVPAALAQKSILTEVLQRAAAVPIVR